MKDENIAYTSGKLLIFSI